MSKAATAPRRLDTAKTVNRAKDILLGYNFLLFVTIVLENSTVQETAFRSGFKRKTAMALKQAVGFHHP